jgi:hypothetical protein
MNEELKNLHTPEDVVVLLTATVEVRGVAFMERQDPEVRFEDYKQALRLWLNTRDSPPLIFCENSGYDLSEIKQITKDCNPYNKQVEFLSFDDNNYPRELGKGYGEIRTIDYALDQSSQTDYDTLIVKVTGRHYIQNIGCLLQGLLEMPRADVYCDMRGNLSWADTRVFCGTVSFLKDVMIPMQETCNDTDGITIEHILARAVHQCLARGGRWAMLPCSPDIRGVSGTSGVTYPNSPWARFKRVLFHRLKRVVLARGY